MFRCRFAWQAQGIGHLVKSEKNVRVLWKNDGRRGTFEEDLARWIFRGRRSTSGVAFWSIRSSVLGRWFCVTGAALRMTWHHFFVAGAVVWTGGVGKSENALVRGRQLCTQLSIFEGSLAELFRFWCCQLRKMRKSRRIVSFLMLSSSKVEEVSQNCFVFDGVKFKTEEVSGNSFVFKLADRQIDR